MNGREVEGRASSKALPMPTTVDKKIIDGIAKRPNGVPRVPYNGPFQFRGYRVTVHNLAPTVTWRDLKDFLRLAGEVRFADVVGPGMGIGEFGTPQERTVVIRSLNGKELKGNKVTIRNLVVQFGHTALFQSSRSFPPYAQAFFPEPVPYGPAPGPAFEAPFAPGFDVYPYNVGRGPVVGPMEYPPVAFGPPPPRLPHWGQSAGRVGRGYPPPFAPPYPTGAPSFPRGHLRPETAPWQFPPAPPRPCLPNRVLEQPPPIPYSQPAPPLRSREFLEHPDEPHYPHNPVPAPGFSEALPDPAHYESRPGAEREYHSYTGRYHASVDGQEKHTTEYNGTASEEWNGHYGHRRDSQSASGRYGKYDPPPPAEKPDSGHIYPPYPRMEDPRVEYPDYRSPVTDEGRKEYSKGGSYTGYWDSSSSYPKPSAEPITDKYNYAKDRATSEAYKYRMEDYHRGDVYPSTDYSSKEHRSAGYDYSRGDHRYASDYKSRESAYYERRSGEYGDRNHRDADLRGAGGPERTTRQRSSHRTGPYDR